jgi:hypothetical protein
MDAIEPRSIYEVDPAVELATIDGARWAGFVAIALGAIFAMLLYVIFASGLLSGAAFPAFDFKDPPYPRERIFLNQFIENGWLSNYRDVGKALVWSFIAGFAERFVPDLIDRLSRSAGAREPDAKRIPASK